MLSRKSKKAIARKCMKNVQFILVVFRLSM